MNADIKTLMQMTIGQIKDLEKQRDGITDIIERQRETVASFLEQEGVEEKWAEDFLKDMEIKE